MIRYPAKPRDALATHQSFRGTRDARWYSPEQDVWRHPDADQRGV